MNILASEGPDKKACNTVYYITIKPCVKPHKTFHKPYFKRALDPKPLSIKGLDKGAEPLRRDGPGILRPRPVDGEVEGGGMGLRFRAQGLGLSGLEDLFRVFFGFRGLRDLFRVFFFGFRGLGDLFRAQGL